MEKDLREQFGMEDESSGDEGEGEGEDSEVSDEDLLEEVVTEENVEDLRQQVEASVNLSDKDKSVLKFLNQCNEAQNTEYSQEILSNDQTDQLEALSLPSLRP